MSTPPKKLVSSSSLKKKKKTKKPCISKFKQPHGVGLYVVIYLIVIVTVTQTMIGGYRVYIMYLTTVYLPLFLGLLATRPIYWFWLSIIAFLLLYLYAISSNYSIFFSEGQCGQSSCYTNRETRLPYNAGGTLGNSKKENIYIPLCPLRDCRVASIQFTTTPIGITVFNTPKGYYKSDTTAFANLSRPCPTDSVGNCDFSVCDCYGSDLSQDYERNKGIGIIDTVDLNMRGGLIPCPGAALSNRESSTVCARCTNAWIARGIYDKETPAPVINSVCNASQAYMGDCFHCVGFAPGERWDSRASQAYFGLYVFTCIFIWFQIIYSGYLTYYYDDKILEENLKEEEENP